MLQTIEEKRYEPLEGNQVQLVVVILHMRYQLGMSLCKQLLEYFLINQDAQHV